MTTYYYYTQCDGHRSILAVTGENHHPDAQLELITDEVVLAYLRG